MSAASQDPLTVSTKDGWTWWRRAFDSAGHGLYARSDAVEVCPTLRTIRELAEFGVRQMSAPEPEGEFYDALHHPYTTPRDMPPLGGQL